MHAGPVEFRSSNGGRGTDARFVRLLAMQAAGGGSGKGGGGGGGKGGGGAKGGQAPGRTQCSELLDISLAEEDVAKVSICSTQSTPGVHRRMAVHLARLSDSNARNASFYAGHAVSHRAYAPLLVPCHQHAGNIRHAQNPVHIAASPA